MNVTHKFNLDLASSWTAIFCIIGGVVVAIGILGFFIIEEKEDLEPSKENYWKTVFYSFRLDVIKENKKSSENSLLFLFFITFSKLYIGFYFFSMIITTHAFF